MCLKEVYTEIYAVDVLLREVGNSLVVTIPKKIVKQAEIKKGEACSIDYLNSSIIIRPKVKKLKGERFLDCFRKPTVEITG